MSGEDRIIEALLRPISGDEPSGADLSFDDVYREIREAKRFDPCGERGEKLPDWASVAAIASDALTNRSKDLQLAVWLTEGWCCCDGLAGAARGVRLLAELMRRYWHRGLYPRQENPEDTREFRLARFEWLNSKLPLLIRHAPGTRDDCSRAAAELARLKTILAEKFGDSAPDLSAIEESLRSKPDNLTLSAPEPEFAAPEREPEPEVQLPVVQEPPHAGPAPNGELAVSVPCGRDEFQRRVGFAEHCMAMARSQVALAILEDLAGRIQRHHLEYWERPDFLGRVLLPLYRCYVEQGDKTRAAQILAQLCRIDPALGVAAQESLP